MAMMLGALYFRIWAVVNIWRWYIRVTRGGNRYSDFSTGDDTNEMGYEKEKNEIREPHLLKFGVGRDLQFRVRCVRDIFE